MIALDTSVLARFILRDSPGELAAAKAFLTENRCAVGWTVLIELCWVLESSAGLPRQEVIDGISAVAAMTNVTVSDRAGLNWVLERYAKGADFSDMVHLVAAPFGSSGFATFDRKLSRQAGIKSPLEALTLRA